MKTTEKPTKWRKEGIVMLALAVAITAGLGLTGCNTSGDLRLEFPPEFSRKGDQWTKLAYFDNREPRLRNITVFEAGDTAGVPLRSLVKGETMIVEIDMGDNYLAKLELFRLLNDKAGQGRLPSNVIVVAGRYKESEIARHKEEYGISFPVYRTKYPVRSIMYKGPKFFTVDHEYRTGIRHLYYKGQMQRTSDFFDKKFAGE